MRISDAKPKIGNDDREGGNRPARTRFMVGLGQAISTGSVLMALTPLAIVGYFSYQSSTESLMKNATDALISASEYKRQTILDYVTRIKKDMESQSELVSNIRFMKKLESRYVASGENIGEFLDSFEWATLNVEDGADLRTFQLTFGYYDVFLVGLDGNVLFTVEEEDDLGTNVLTDKYAESGLGKAFRGALETGEMLFSDLAPYGPSDDLPSMFLANVLEDDETGETIGVLIFQLPAAKISNMMKENIGLGETGETFLVGPDSFMRSNARHIEESTILKTTIATAPVTAWMAYERARHNPAHAGELGVSPSKHGEVILYRDYRSVDVLGLAHNLEFLEELGLHWALVAKIDQAEAFSPIVGLQRVFMVLLSVTLVAVFFLSWFISRRIVSPIRELTNWSRRIAAGDLSDMDVTAPFYEIGSLNDGFGKAVISLRQAESKLKFSRDKLIDRTELLKLLYTVTTIANESENIDKVLENSLKEICEYLGWPVGHIYTVSGSNPDKLVPKGAWRMRGSRQFSTFREITKKTEFTRGVGMPGRVLESGEPEWIEDVTGNPKFLRWMPDKGIGLKACFCFPIKVRNKVVAVMEFFSAEIKEPNEPLLQAVDNIGTQLGQVIERKQAEEERRLTHKMQALGGLAAGISHNFNNLLQPILGLSERVARKMPRGSEERKQLDVVTLAARRSKELVVQILAFARQSEPKLGRADARLFADSALELIRLTVPTSIILEERLEEVGNVFIDTMQMENAILNIITNAIDAISGGNGTITFSLSRAEVDEGKQQSFLQLKPGTYAKLSIADTGCGIDEEILGKIFDPFFTTKEPGAGSGLGLSTTFGIVASHNGAVHAASTPGKGSTFVIYLPLIETGRVVH
ncbi:MAG: hypothetical protein CMF63_08800 [Magnetovibrio sp.]|nr:hypothetical protein [Magnetovibrio sp.]